MPVSPLPLTFLCAILSNSCMATWNSSINSIRESNSKWPMSNMISALLDQAAVSWISLKSLMKEMWLSKFIYPNDLMDYLKRSFFAASKGSFFSTWTIMAWINFKTLTTSWFGIWQWEKAYIEREWYWYSSLNNSLPSLRIAQDRSVSNYQSSWQTR